MPKAKMRLVIECEMELNPEYYDSGSSFDDMAKVEKQNAIDDPYTMIDIMLEKNGNIDLEVTGVE